MGLQWIRLDANIASHDKILALLDTKPAASAYQAAFSYVCSLGYSGGHETDGLVEFSALRFVHGTKKTAQLLVEHFLWTPDRLGWQIVNFDKRQQLAATTKTIRNAQRAGARKGNCRRWHGEDCKCWEGAA